MEHLRRFQPYKGSGITADLSCLSRMNKTQYLASQGDNDKNKPVKTVAIYNSACRDLIVVYLLKYIVK